MRWKEAMVKEKRVAWEVAPDFLRAPISGGAEARAAREEPGARLRAFQRLKEGGSEKIRAGGYKAESRAYSNALSVFICFQQTKDSADNLPLVNSLQELPSGQAHEHVCTLFLNLALCSLKLKAFHAAAHSATQALQLDAGNTKAFYFCAMANAAKEASYTLDLAVQDLERAAEAIPRGHEIMVALKKCRAEMRAQDKKDRSAFGNMFKKQDGIGGGLYPEEAGGGDRQGEHREPSPNEFIKLIKKSDGIGFNLKVPAMWDEIELYRWQERLPQPIRYIVWHSYGALAYIFYGLAVVFTV